MGLLFDDPSVYLSEICLKMMTLAGIDVSPATICHVIHRNGFTRKKIQQVALQRSVEHSGKFFAEIQFYNPNQFVWVDETGSDRRDQMRKFGYSLKSESPVCH